MDFLKQKQPKPGAPLFIIVSQDYSGLGWAKMVVDEGYPVILAYRMKEDEDSSVADYNRVGKGMIPRMPLNEVIKNRKQYKEAYWIWDGNHNSEEADALRKLGFKVFGGQVLTDQMEHDRNFGAAIIKKAGIKTPETHEFSKISEGMAFVESRPEEAFVFKPDHGKGSWTTYVPNSPKDEAANRELLAYMSTLPEDGDTYILQKRIKGVETNFEIWLDKGKPFFAFCVLESKRKLAHDEGEMVGCAHDLAFTIPLNAKALHETLYKLLPQFKDYTGFLDINVIIHDSDCYFLEFCARYGYNSHPNLFLNLAKKSFPEIMMKFMDGETDNFYDYFRAGFGASISMYIDHPSPKNPIYIAEEAEQKFFHWDTYLAQGGEYRLAGYSNEVGVICGHAFTILEAAKEAKENYERVNYPCRAGRLDQDQKDYPSNPQSRYEALDAMRFFDPVRK